MLKSEEISEVFVSLDDMEILATFKASGVKIIKSLEEYAHSSAFIHDV